MKKNTNVTIITIAKEANVSIATVSRYFSHPWLLKPSTKEQLKKIIDKYGFFPSLVGIQNNPFKNIRISFLFNSMAHKSNTHETVEGILRGALIYNYTLMLFLDQEERAEHCLDNIIRNKSSFLISTKIKDDNFVRVMKKNNVKLGYIIPYEDLNSTIINEDDIVLTYKKTPDYFFLGIVIVSLFKQSLNSKEKWHKIVDGENLKSII